jgi:DNA-binding response OmpR family regulator
MSDDPMRILIVDDEESFALGTALRLKENYGYETTLLTSGREAIETLGTAQQQFDVVLLDYMMPDVNGLNVLQWMHEEKNNTPVIMLTGAGTEHIAVEAMKLGAYDYVQKNLIDIGHLDIILRGTHERHLFRKEKEHRLQMLKDRDRMLTSLEFFQSSIDLLSHVVNNSLAFVALNMQEHSEALAVDLKEETQNKIHEAFEEMEREYSFIASVVALILKLSIAMQEMLTSGATASSDHITLQTEIESLAQAHKEKMDS